MPETSTITVPAKWRYVFTHKITYGNGDGLVSIDQFVTLEAAERCLHKYPVRGGFVPYIGPITPVCGHGKPAGGCDYFDCTGVCIHHKLAPR